MSRKYFPAREGYPEQCRHTYDTYSRFNLPPCDKCKKEYEEELVKKKAKKITKRKSK